MQAAFAPVSFTNKSVRQEGKIVSYGMSDDWVNLGLMWKNFTNKYGISHTDEDMTSAEQIVRLQAEKKKPVMDVADIGYDALGELVANGLSMAYQNSSWNSIPDNFKDQNGLWTVGYWGAIAFLVNTDTVKDIPSTWNDLLKDEYHDMICSRDPRQSSYATASVLAAAYANGGSEQNIQPGLDLFAKLRKSGNLRDGVELNLNNVKNGQCPIAIVYDFDGLNKRDATGLPLKIIIPEDATVGMLFAEYINQFAPHPNAAKAWIDFMLSDQGQILLADGYAHPVRKVKLPPTVAAKQIPEKSYKHIYFPTGLEGFSAAVKNIAEGWNDILQNPL